MASPLADLDELVLKCRDDKAKKYIKEAVECYKSGAFRSSIVSTWIAVTFDLIDKFKELSALGDKEAEKQVEELEKARRINDISRFLQLEREIVEVARDKLELISHTESVDLERLQEDRNRCAHPSMNLEGEIFNPSAELARLHIRSAVNHLLQFPPSQGKYALERLISEVESKYFPTRKEDILLTLKSSPLIKPRHSLLRNVMVVLFKKALDPEIDALLKMKIHSVIGAIGILHKVQYDEILNKDLSRIVQQVPDKELKYAVDLLVNIDDSWVYLDNVVQLKLTSYVSDLPSEDFDYFEQLLNYKPLLKSAEKRLGRATMRELRDIIPFDIDDRIIDRMIDIYALSNNFYEANGWVEETRSYVSDFSEGHISKIINVASENNQITGSNEFPKLVRAIRSRKVITDQELNELLKKNGIEDLVVKVNPELT